MLTGRVGAMLFVVGPDATGQVCWRLLDRRRHHVASAGRTYVSLGHADQAAHEFRVGAEAWEYACVQRETGRWSWSARRGDGSRVAVSAGDFPDEPSARSAAESVRHALATAIGP